MTVGNVIKILNHQEYIKTYVPYSHRDQYFTDITDGSGITFIHQENTFTDFNRQWYIPHELSTEGPKVAAVADVNKDGLEDFFVCGAKSQAEAIYLQQPDANFRKSADTLVFLYDRECEDVDATFFDANNDGYPDLYVVSGETNTAAIRH